MSRAILPWALAALAAGCAATPDAGPSDAPAQDPKASIRLILNDPLSHPSPRDACDAEHCQALLELIEGAQDSIDFAVYGMRNQSDILRALEAAKQRGVTLRGIVDRDLEGNNIYASTPDLVEVVGRVHSDEKVDRRLTRKESRFADREPACERPPGFAGPVQCLAYDLGEKCLLAAHASREELEGREAIMHNKFFVVDGRFVWTGSTNISDSGTGGYNANLVTVADSQKIAGWYTAEFEQMFTAGRYHTTKASHGELRAALGDSDVEVLFSPQDRPIRSAVQPLLREATDSIDIAVFFLTHKHITTDLIEAHQRGVKVRVILDATGAKNGYTKHELLRAAGIPVKVENWGGKMHMKSAVIDGKHLVTGSMNWTSAGEYSNDENTIIIHSPRHAEQYAEFFEHLWSSIPDRWLEANPDPESKDSGTSCTDGADNDFDDQADHEDPGCSDTQPPLPALPPWRIVPKGNRLTCEVGMDE